MKRKKKTSWKKYIPETLSEKIGVGLLLYVFLLLLHTLINTSFSDFFWYCTIMLLTTSYALVTKNEILLKITLIQALGVQIIWISDTAAIMFFSKSIFYQTSYLANGELSPMGFFFALRHFFLIPFLFLYYTYQKFPFQWKKELVYFISYYWTMIIVSFSINFIYDSKVNCQIIGECGMGTSFPSKIGFIILLFLLLISTYFIVSFLLRKFFSLPKKIVFTVGIIILTFMIILLITTIAQYIYPNVIECEIDDNYFEDAACFNLDQYENHLRLYVPDADCINLSYITHSKEKYAVLYPQKNSFFDLHNVTQDGNSTVVVRILECNS